MMLLNITIACLLFVGTTVIHAGGMALAFQLRHQTKRSVKQTKLTRVVSISSIVILMFLVSVAEVLLWAVVYLGLGAIESLERAFYFSMVTFTTLGYGDIVLPEQWQLLSSFEAANGIIMFGWTTSIVIAVVTRIYFRNNPEEE